MPEAALVFKCKKCGQCCEGRGGIVLSPADLSRLAAFLGSGEDVVRREYAEVSNGKLKIRIGTDGKCVFFREGQGCIVHEGKPDICRAWPFFRGNLLDPVSFALAREFCPGIGRDVTFLEFSQAGRDWIACEKLGARNPDTEANALIMDNLTGLGAP